MESGVYYGWAGVDIDDTGLRKRKEGKGEGKGGGVWGMVMSIGWNPYYKNEVRSVVCAARVPCLFRGKRSMYGWEEVLIMSGSCRKFTS